MGNMGYCRFRNTKRDLNECLMTLHDEERLSGYEWRACYGMFKEFLNFCFEVGILEEDQDEVMERLEDYMIEEVEDHFEVE